MKIRNTIISLMLVTGSAQAADLAIINNAIQDARNCKEFHNAVTCMNIANLTRRVPMKYIVIAKESVDIISRSHGITDQKEQAFVFTLAASNSWAYTSGQIKALSYNQIEETRRANDIYMHQCFLVEDGINEA